MTEPCRGVQNSVQNALLRHRSRDALRDGVCVVRPMGEADVNYRMCRKSERCVRSRCGLAFVQHS